MQTHESPTVRLNRVTEQRYSPVGPPRESRIGSWYPLASTYGSLHEGLLVRGAPLADPAFALRVSTHVRQIMAARVPGLVKIVDCLYDEQQMWLITDTPPQPTLAQLATAAGAIPGPAAIAVAAASGHTLSALHAEDLRHGGLHLESVSIAPSGDVMLLEVGLARAFAGTALRADDDDARGWARLLREISALCPDRHVAASLRASATAAESAVGAEGIHAGLRTLAAERIARTWEADLDAAARFVGGTVRTPLPGVNRPPAAGLQRYNAAPGYRSSGATYRQEITFPQNAGRARVEVMPPQGHRRTIDRPLVAPPQPAVAVRTDPRRRRRTLLRYGARRIALTDLIATGVVTATLILGLLYWIQSG
ncbi:hypothetical protein OG767_10220 [Micromonospora sp. NBC_01392]|uniref:hypothetical protein n=1 Tax=Micromonospora sp. NBC_01392 TaxID=2903588 RepID=UPI003256441B